MLANNNEYLQEAADSLYKANADEIIREQCRARKDAERIERTLKRDLIRLTQENTVLQEDNTSLKEDNASLKEDITFLQGNINILQNRVGELLSRIQELESRHQ